MSENVVLQFIAYTPKIFSGFDKYNIALNKKAAQQGYKMVYVFSGPLDKVVKLEKELKESGALIEMINLRSNLIFLFYDIFKLYVRYRPVLTISHFEIKIKIITALLSFFTKTKHLTYFHSKVTDPIAKRLQDNGKWGIIQMRLFLKLLFHLSDKVIFISEALKEQFMEYMPIYSTKLTVLYLGIDLQNNNLSASIGNNPQKDHKVRFANIAAIEPIKGIDVWINAVNQLVKTYKHKDFIFYHYGDIRIHNDELIKYRQEMQALVHKYNLENFIKWEGFVNEAINKLSMIDVYVHPSREEGLGVANIEAARCSLPIIGSKSGGIPEIVHHNTNGFLIDNEDFKSLAFYMDKLIKDKSTRNMFGSSSKKIVNEYFNMDKQVTKMVALINNTLKHA